MNKVVLIGRLTRDPEVRYSAGDNPICVCRYTLAVDRRFKRQDTNDADFIRCVVFGKSAEFAEKYFHQGIKIGVVGRITTGSYMNKEGVKVYTTEVTVEEQEFVESKAAGARRETDGSFEKNVTADDEGFTAIMQGVSDDIPF